MIVPPYMPELFEKNVAIVKRFEKNKVVQIVFSTIFIIVAMGMTVFLLFG